MNVFIDIETIPTQPEEETKAAIVVEPPASIKKQETLDAWHKGEGKYAGVKDALIEETYRKTALDGAKGEVISVCFSVEGNQYTKHRSLGYSESELISDVFCGLEDCLEARPPFFIGHNIRFDLKFLWHRAVILGIDPCFKLPFSGRHNSDFFCTMEAWAGFNQRISQDNLCKALGIEGKPDGISGANVWDHVKAGDIGKVAEYNADDVQKVEAIYNRLNFIN
jgi:predicted PolB exonuclease-like 3'-5' exonuclease